MVLANRAVIGDIRCEFRDDTHIYLKLADLYRKMYNREFDDKIKFAGMI